MLKGKTSLMEAIYFASTGRSFRTKKTSEMIKYEKEDAKVFIKGYDNNSFSVNLMKNEKKFYLNGEKIKYVEYIGNILAISFIPEDVELITGNPSIRRSFFNYEISQINKEYLKLIIEYEKVLKLEIL